MSLLRFLGLGGDAAGRDAEPSSLIELGASLESMEPGEARLAAGFAYLLARVAGADLRTEESEEAAIAERLTTFAELAPETAAVLAQAAIRVTEAHGGSDDHLVARAFRDMTEHAGACDCSAASMRWPRRTTRSRRSKTTRSSRSQARSVWGEPT